MLLIEAVLTSIALQIDWPPGLLRVLDGERSNEFDTTLGRRSIYESVENTH
jgi:hypothetical protein